MNCPHCGAEIPDENWGLFNKPEVSSAIKLPRYGDIIPADIIKRMVEIETMLNAGFLPGSAAGEVETYGAPSVSEGPPSQLPEGTIFYKYGHKGAFRMQADGTDVPVDEPEAEAS